MEKVDVPSNYVLDVIHYKGQFLAANCSGNILACDVDGPHPAAQIILEKPLEIRENLIVQLYLVELVGPLLLVSRLGNQDGGTNEFQVFVVDLDARKWIELESMGTHPFSWVSTLLFQCKLMKTNTLSNRT